MGRKANPALIGGFVVGAAALAVAGLMILGGGRFFRDTQAWVAYFDESIKGLAVGAPVTFRGIRIGQVTHLKVIVDPKTTQIRTPVFFEIETKRMTDVEGRRVQLMPDETNASALIQKGLRARLEMQSIVTGQLAIDFDFHPDSPVRLTGAAPAGIPEFPTVPSAMSAIGRGLQDLNMAEVVRDLQETMRGISNIVNGPEVKQTLASSSRAMQRIERLAADADRQVATLAPIILRASENIDGTLAAMRTLVRRVDAETVPALTEAAREAQHLLRRADGETLPALTETAHAAQHLLRRVDAETVPAVNQALADVRPLLEEAARAVTATRSTLEQAQRALGTLDGTLDAGSPLQHQLQITLREVSTAARAVRALSSFLERHPEAVLHGKEEK